MALPWDLYGEAPSEPELPYRPPAPVTSPPAPAPAPTPPAPDPTPADVGKELVKADAASRSKRTLIQGLIVDVIAAIVASIAMLSGADPFIKETWIGLGILVVKSVISATISYFMRLRKAPTIRTKGEKLALMPVPRPMYDNERNIA